MLFDKSNEISYSVRWGSTQEEYHRDLPTAVACRNDSSFGRSFPWLLNFISLQKVHIVIMTFAVDIGEHLLAEYQESFPSSPFLIGFQLYLASACPFHSPGASEAVNPILSSRAQGGIRKSEFFIYLATAIWWRKGKHVTSDIGNPRLFVWNAGDNIPHSSLVVVLSRCLPRTIWTSPSAG